MKVLLIQPPIEDFYQTEIRLQPIGLAYLKGTLQKFLPHIEVKILDFHHGFGRMTIPLPRELRYLRPYYEFPDQSPFSTFHHYYHFGAGDREIEKRIRQEQPDVIGISSLFSPYYREALRIASLAKQAGVGHVVMGGSHVSSEPLMMLQDPHVDFIIRGEGERPLVELLRTLEIDEVKNLQDVPNLGFKQDAKLILNDIQANYDLDQIPPPDMSDFSLQDYLFEKKPLTFLVTSRSCPHHCSFCSVHQTFGHSFRRYSIDRVWEEILLRYAQGYRVFDFEDDNLTFYQDEMKDLCQRIIAHFGEGNLELLAMNGISYLSLDGDLLKLMRRAGFTHLNLSLVSSDKSVLLTTKRPHTIEKYLEVVRNAFRLGFKMVSYQILGLPFETLESMIQTFIFQARLPILMGSSMFYLTPQSPIAKQLGHVSTSSECFRSRSTAIAYENEEIKREDIYTLFVATRIINFLKSLPVKPHESIALEEWFDGSFRDTGLNPRQQTGLEILRVFWKTGIFCAHTSRGLFPLKRLKATLLRRILQALGFLSTQTGAKIFIHFQQLEIPAQIAYNE